MESQTYSKKDTGSVDQLIVSVRTLMSHNILVMGTKLKAGKKIISNFRKNSDPRLFNLKSGKQILVSQECFSG